MPVGVGVGVPLGSATIYLFADASGMRSGLAQAERDALAVQKRVNQRSRQESRSNDAAKSAAEFQKIVSRFNDPQIIAFQKRVADQFATTANNIEVSYKKRDGAIKRHQALVARETAITENAARAQKAAADIQKKSAEAAIAAQKTLAAAQQRGASGRVRQSLGGSLGAARAADLRNQKLLTAATDQYKAQKIASDAAIRASALATQRIIEGANKRQEASIKEVRDANNQYIQSLRNVAKQAGPEYENMVDRLEAANNRLINAEEEVAKRRIRLQNATARRQSGDPTASNFARLKIDEENAQRSLRRSVATLNAARASQERTERAFTTRIKKLSDDRIKKADQEAQRLKEAIAQEEQARKVQRENELNRATSTLTVATGAMIGVVRAATSAFGNYEQALTNAYAISSDLEDISGEVESKISDLAVQLGRSPTELANALNEIAQAGIMGRDALDLMEVAARGAAAGNTDAVTAAKPLIGVFNAFGEEAGNSTEVMNKLFQAVTAGVFSFEDLSQQLGDNISIAKSLGVSLDELLTAYVVLTKRSNNLSESTTQVNAVMNAFLKPSQALTDAVKEMTGQTAQAYFRTHDLADVLVLVDKMFQKNADSAGQLIPNIRAIRGIFGLSTKEAEQFREQLVEMGKAQDHGGRAAIVLARQQKALNFQLAQTKEQLRQVVIGLGANMAPLMASTARIAAQVARAFIALNQATGGMLGKIVFITTGLMVLATAMLRVKLAFLDGKQAVITLIQSLVGMVQRAYAAAVALNALNAAILPSIAITAAVALVAYKLWQRHKKQKEAADALRKSYKDLNATMEAFAGRRDLTNDEATSLRATQQAIEDVIGASTKMREELEKERTARRNALGPVQVANELDKKIFGREAFGNIDELNKKINDLLDDTEKGALNDDINKIFAFDDLDVTKTTGRINELLSQFSTGKITADQFAAGVHEIAGTLDSEYSNAAAKATNAQVKLGESLVNTGEFFVDLDAQADNIRKGLQSFTEEVYTSVGALDNMDDPLSFITTRLGTMGEGAAETVLRLNELGTIKLSDDQVIGVEALARVDAYQRKLDEVNKTLSDSNDRIGEWQRINQHVTELIGTETDGFAALQDMVNRGKLTQQEANDVMEAGLYLQRKSTIEVDNERVAQAKALPEMAKWVQQHDLAGDAYDKLTPAQKAFSESLKDTSNQMIVMTTLMYQLIAAMNPDVVNQDFFKEFIRGIAIANPEALALLDTLHLIPDEIKTDLKLEFGQAGMTPDEVNAELRDTLTQIDQLQNTPVVIDTESGQKRLADLQERARLLEQKQVRMTAKLNTDDIDAKLEKLDTEGLPNLTDAAQQTGDRWNDVFKSMELSVENVSDAAADAAQNVLQQIGAIRDVSDPMKFLNQSLGTTDLTLQQVIGKIDVIKGPIKLDVDEQEALRLYNTLKKTEDRILKLDDAIAQNADDISMWEGRISFIDETIGTSEDTLASYQAQLASGKITQEEFNQAVASGEAHSAYAELNQLLKAGLITEKEYQQILKAGQWIRDRAVGGVMDERAEQAKMIPQLAALIQLHDRQDASYDKLTGSQKRFLAGLANENVQMALSTALMLAQLEAMGAVAEGTTNKFVKAISDANPEIGAFFDEIEFDAKNANPVMKVQIVEDPNATADDVVKNADHTVSAAGIGLKIPVTTADNAPDTITPPTVNDVTFAVHADISPALTDLLSLDKQGQTLAYNAGFNVDWMMAQAIQDNIGFISSAIQSGPNLALVRNIAGAGVLGTLIGRSADYGVARGLISNSGPVAAAANYVARLIYATMVRSLLIHSPSKKGEFIGTMVMRGIGNSMLAEGQVVISQARRIAEGIVGAFDSTFQSRTMPALLAGQPGIPGRNGTPIGRPSVPLASSTTSNSSVFQVDIDVNGASGDGKAIAQDIWRELHGSLRRLNHQVVPA
jgi:TP901 family phage tail tape measure protein